MQRIYLDYASATPLLPEVKEAMALAQQQAGNPSSIHQRGVSARQQLESARKQVAALINARPHEIYFTSCGTESNNWALRGLLGANRRKGNHIVISAIEHPSLSQMARRLELEGASVSILPVNAEGFIQPGALKEVMRGDTVLVSVMLANGEIGTIEPVRELSAIAHEHGALMHTDAVAAAGYLLIDVQTLGVDALSLAANAFYGPQGAAALFVREGVRILPLLEGGGQEQGGRSGTEALAAIVGMGAAAELAQRHMEQRVERLIRLRNRLREGLSLRVDGLHFYGSWNHRMPHNVQVCVDGLSNESLVLGLDQAGVMVGLGSACNSKAMRPSAVLRALGLRDDEISGALVLSVGVPTTEKEIDRAVELFALTTKRLRNVVAMTR